MIVYGRPEHFQVGMLSWKYLRYSSGGVCTVKAGTWLFAGSVLLAFFTERQYIRDIMVVAFPKISGRSSHRRWNSSLIIDDKFTNIL